MRHRGTPTSHNGCAVLPTFVISGLGCNVRVAAVISQAPRPVRRLHLSAALLLLLPRIRRCLPRIVQVRRSERRLGTVCGSVIVGGVRRDSSCDKTVEGPPPRAPPHSPSLSLAPSLQPMPARLRHVMRAAGLQ